MTVEEYLHSAFEHDAEYVEGRVVPRPKPRQPHSRIQGYLDRTLYQVGHPLGYQVWVEQRVRTQKEPPRYRVPDVCLTTVSLPKTSLPSRHSCVWKFYRRTTLPSMCAPK
jgi:Uma2 family endonuclease